MFLYKQLTESFSDRPTDGEWNGPRIHVWTWQDTRDEFGDDDRGGFHWGGDGGGGAGGFWSGDGGGVIEGEDDDCGRDGFPSDGMEGNHNWHSDSRPDGKADLNAWS